MEPNSPPGIHDPQLDLHPRGRAIERGPIDEFRRLIVNPCLTVLAAIAAALVVRTGLEDRRIEWFIAGVCVLGLSVRLLQFHCLDCGATGWLLRSRRHVCPALTERWRTGRLGRIRPPAVRSQIVLWVYVLAAVAALALIVRMRN